MSQPTNPPVFDAAATHARTRPHALACVELEDGQRWTYRALDADINRVSGWLVAELGPRSGARVAVIARNSVWTLILQLAAMRAGAVFVPLNWRLAVPEFAVLLADCAPALIFHDPEFALPETATPIHPMSALASLPGDPPPPDARNPSDMAATLLYTSGTSGKPKGVIITELNAFWGSVNFITGNELSPGCVTLCDMPMFHTAGLFATVRSTIQAGATLLISRGFEAARTLERIADPALGVTHYFSVPQMAQQMWQLPGFSPEKLRGLKIYAMGGAPNPGAQIARFVKAGIPMSDGYGMSETCSNFAMPFGNLDIILAKAGSCGVPLFSVQARIVDVHGNDVPPGERGELLLRGPSITPGYWNQPELTAKSFIDGWFKTGDIARRDQDGFYYLVDRAKDMFISGGENVYPVEVEAVLAELDAVADAAVIGVPDERWGEVGRAYVVTRPGYVLTEADVLAHCAARLAKFKVPKSVVVDGAIPRTATGKVQKHVLKAGLAGP